MKTILYSLLVCFITLSLSSSAYASSFWKISGNDKQRVSDVKATMATCEKGLRQYFPQRPNKLEIILYPTREAFLDGLQDVLGFSRESALRFKDHGAPRPIDGKMLVPPDQKLENVCHEVVHHYLESFTNRDYLLNAKWFDEGIATLFAARIIGGKKAESSANLSQIIPLEKMTTEKQWSALWSEQKSRDSAYNQAALMMGFFFTKYSIEQFQKILVEMNTKSLDVVFKDVIGISINDFYKAWLSQKEKI